MCFTGINTGWAVGDKGLVMNTTDGETFSEHAPICDADLLSASTDKMNRVVISASDGKLYRINN
jgi:hypothetical protein